jgi:sigma-B regulation protein RsbU (phosphoserine phosphatase)
MLLRTRLSIIMAGGFAALTLVLAGGGVLQAKIMEQRLAETALAGQAALWNETTGVEASQLLRALNTVANLAEFQAAVAAADTPSARKVLQANGIDVDAADRSLSMVAVFAADRDSLFAAGLAPGTQILDAASFDRVLAGAEIGGLRQSATGRPYLLAARPWTLNGRRAVLVVGRSALAAMERMAHRLGGSASLIGLRGNLLTTTDAALWQRAGLRPSARLASFDELELEDRIFSVASVPVADIAGGSAGALVMLADVTASQSTRRLLSRWAGGGALALALAGIAALNIYLWRSFRPLQSAIDALQALSRGDASVRIEAHGRDEIGRIGEAVTVFRRDALSLAATRSLRDRVRRRQESVIQRELLTLAKATGSSAPDDVLQALPAPNSAPGAGADMREDGALRRLARVMGELTGRIIEQHQSLSSMVVELREALRVKTQLIALQQELEIARKMQMAILPRSFQERGGLAIHATMTPAKQIGGDFYDHFEIDEHRIAITVADVSGKGVPAALFMAVSRTLLRAVARFSDSPADCLSRLNDLLAVDNEQMMFVTLFYIVIDTRDGTAVYANAGHNLPYVLRGNGAIEAIPATEGMALAILEGVEFEEARLVLAPGDGLFMYTDGVTEAFDPKAQMFGEERLEALLAQIREYPVEDFPGRVQAQVKSFEDGGPQSDDITCLMARWRECS